MSEHPHWAENEPPKAKALREHIRKMRRMWDGLVSAIIRKDQLAGEIVSKHTEEQRRHDLGKRLDDVEGRIDELDRQLTDMERRLRELDQLEQEERQRRRAERTIASRGSGPAAGSSPPGPARRRR
jgi:TolA-binding protein